MQDHEDLSEQIALTTTKIQEQFPELIKFMGEIPITLQPNDEKGVSHKELKDYLDSLNDLLKTYQKKLKT